MEDLYLFSSLCSYEFFSVVLCNVNNELLNEKLLGNLSVLDSFNKKETDFATLQEYNNYLEEVETISM